MKNNDNSSVPNNVSNVSNIDNLVDDYEQEIFHFNIYDSKNWKNHDNKSKDILVEIGINESMTHRVKLTIGVVA